MVNLGPGVPQQVNPGVTPTWIFSPNPSANSTVRISNAGPWPVYVGGLGVSQPDALAIPPNSRPVELMNVTQTLYAISGVSIGAAGGTMTSAAVTAGTTAITLTATVPTSMGAGATIVLGNTASTGWEAQIVATTTASSGLTFASPLTNDHVASSVVFLATPQYGQLRVNSGVV